MIKIARKPSTDPVQEKLRTDKASWNKEVSVFVNDLIHLKKLMNGYPSKFHMERSFIKDEMPGDPATIIGSLATDFQEITQSASRLVQQQLDYSKNRKKRQPKQLNLPFKTPSAPTTKPEETSQVPDLSKQLSLPLSASQKYELITEGSNPLTRFFARLLNPAIGGSQAARIRKYRMSLLTAALNTYKDLEKLQSHIMGSSPESIFTAGKVLSKIEDQWMFISQGFTTYVESMPDKILDVGGNIEPPANKENNKIKPIIPTDTQTTVPVPTQNDTELLAAQEAVIDFRRNMATFLHLSTKQLNDLIVKFSTTTDEAEKRKLALPLLIAYHSVIAVANTKYNTSGNSFKEIVDAQNKTASFTQLEKIAQNFLSKWLGKLKHQISPFDKTSAFRLDIYEKCDIARKSIDKIMDLLEKGMSIEELTGLINKVGQEIITIRDLMRALDTTIRGKGFNNTFMNLLDSKKIMEHNPQLDDKQKQHLQRLLEQRNMRDLTNLYKR